MVNVSKSVFFCRIDKRGFFFLKFLFWMKWNFFYKFNDYDDFY